MYDKYLTNSYLNIIMQNESNESFTQSLYNLNFEYAEEKIVIFSKLLSQVLDSDSIYLKIKNRYELIDYR